MVVGRQTRTFVVAGAGISGLATAARLAAAGHRVVVCEQRPAWDLRRDAHDVPALTTLPQVFREFTAATGMAWPLDRDRAPVLRRHRLPGGITVDFPGHNPARTIAAALGPRAAQQWRRYCHRAAPLFAAQIGAILAPAPHAAPPDPARLARTIMHPQLRTLVEREAYRSDRPVASRLTGPYATAAFGVWPVTGGMAGLRDSLEQTARRHGTVVFTGAQVTAMEGGGTPSARLATGERLPADAVVATPGAAQTIDVRPSAPLHILDGAAHLGDGPAYDLLAAKAAVSALLAG